MKGVVKYTIGAFLHTRDHKILKYKQLLIIHEQPVAYQVGAMAE